ncbi:hypothetical protein JXQ70_01780 [bacterium]|nr:hypothetical protein [bacterium]
MNSIKPYLWKSVFFIMVFVCLVIVRCQWDSYRFYRLGLQYETIDPIASIRYYGCAIRAQPLFNAPAQKARQRLETFKNNSDDARVQLMIVDELSVR